MALHPYFQLSPVALLHFSKNTWLRYCAFDIAEGADEGLTGQQEKSLRIAALAMLYHLADIKQDLPWLPDWNEVYNQWSSLMALSYWKAYLDSARFRFPAIHISKLEASHFSLKAYLQECWNVKKSYETTVNERIEIEKLKAAEEATIALRAELAGAKPTSNRQVWRWFVANLPKRYSKDIETWMPELFFSKGEEVSEYTLADIKCLEDIMLVECPIGTSISHAFREILEKKRQYIAARIETFEILIPETIATDKASGEIPPEEPKLADYPKRVLWMIAHAKWKLAHTDMLARMAAAGTKKDQDRRTVSASFVPELVIGDGRDEGETDEDDVVLDALEAAEQEAADESGELEE